ncbi:SPW repeat domain-containing protein [Saccharomonospora xinjiangensis]|uniref:SPW repeat-containing integral membrane domain-containing protein n=1 Tax=Saccharomonospora xinjiangensis XJ-54 TaxID=882086 RepID=I0UZX0_9PSEU|nr:SPW repeat protein [Saccharomonospora xinjiangensis]EID53423.1 hypothetical protein SacxiDRAFT_1164 [Saccharomonospora xinjiangensis XJ-54]
MIRHGRRATTAKRLLLRPSAPEEPAGPWKGMRPPHANPSAVPEGRKPEPEQPPASHRTSPVPYQDVLAGLPAAIAFLAGVWLIVSPVLIDHPATVLGVSAAVPDVVAGVVLAAFGAAKAVSPFVRQWAGWATMLVGIWLIVAPFAMNYHGAEEGVAVVNDVVAGAVVVAMSIASLILGARWGGRRSEIKRSGA